ncbi:MAG: a-glycosyltransferase-related protein glycosyltransferase family 4 protein [Mucilaginibacter sp.]|nr:a-glycosyltransferase-related protein glycosyltransferase family 4 protein [Mucilaginibacter sp.]
MQRLNTNQNCEPVKLAFLSAGLGNISRGFETSCSTWFDVIENRRDIDARLFSGRKYKTSTKILNCPRNGHVATILRYARLINDGCRLEQITFSLGFLIQLISYRPDIIWIQEATLGNMLLKFRKIFGFKYKLVFCDGAPVGYWYAKRFDYLIFLHQHAMNEAIYEGVDNRKCRVIPHLSLFPINPLTKSDARNKLNINKEKFVIICVAAWNKHHKRIDYLVNEVALLNSKEVTLLLCGQPEKDSLFLKNTADKLAIDVRWHTLSQEDLSIAYLASDLFVLPSLNEALGAVLIEAGAHGLPVICHKHQAGKFIFGENYPGLTDLSKEGKLAEKILDIQNTMNIKKEGFETERIIKKKFNRNKLTEDFVKFIEHIYENERPVNYL